MWPRVGRGRGRGKMGMRRSPQLGFEGPSSAVLEGEGRGMDMWTVHHQLLIKYMWPSTHCLLPTESSLYYEQEKAEMPNRVCGGRGQVWVEGPPQHTQSQLGAESCPRRPREHLTKISPSLSAGGSLASPQDKEFRVLGTLCKPSVNIDHSSYDVFIQHSKHL